jgi:hypothetical protein
VPSIAARPRRPLLRVVAVGVVGLAVGVGAILAAARLGGGQDHAASVQRLDLPAAVEPLPAPPAADAVKPVRAGSARAAVQRFLRAGATGDDATAYALLDRSGRRRYPSLARWTRAQADRPPVTGVRVGTERKVGAATTDVTVTLSHPPAIDPFTGLVPARTVEVWRARRAAGGGWRVAPDPVSVRAVLPGADRAPAAVTAWVERLVGCDRQGAASLQAGAELYGPADLAEAPCRERGRWTVAAPLGFDAAVEPQPYVAAFGSDVGGWARLVPVTGPRTRFHVVVGPLGDGWRVLGTDPVSSTR